MSKQSILALGATGGCVLSFLIKAIEGGHSVVALVRSEAKLQKLLTDRSVSADLVNKHLRIVTGDVKNKEDVSKALSHESIPNGIVDVIVSGVGSIPVFTPNPLRPTLQDPTICNDATATVLEVLRGLKSTSKKPHFIVISTTGISDHGRDIPLAMIPLYHWMLPVPHADKKKMEQLLEAESKKTDAVISGFTAVRPSLLTDGALLGIDSVTSDVETDGHVAKKAIGYTISRNDVGNWIYSKIVDAINDDYVNKFVVLTQ